MTWASDVTCRIILHALTFHGRWEAFSTSLHGKWQSAAPLSWEDKQGQQVLRFSFQSPVYTTYWCSCKVKKALGIQGPGNCSEGWKWKVSLKRRSPVGRRDRLPVLRLCLTAAHCVLQCLCESAEDDGEIMRGLPQWGEHGLKSSRQNG